MPKWTADEVRRLRLRLGWSQSDLARRLGCRQQTISEWETGIYEPQNAYSRLLDICLNHVESHSNQIIQRPIADHYMKSNKVTQVFVDEIADEKTIDSTSFDVQVD